MMAISISTINVRRIAAEGLLVLAGTSAGKRPKAWSMMLAIGMAVDAHVLRGSLRVWNGNTYRAPRHSPLHRYDVCCWDCAAAGGKGSHDPHCGSNVVVSDDEEVGCGFESRCHRFLPAIKCPI